jgi:anti-sigma regulatory factor (Ser/Thr protein kinase)
VTTGSHSALVYTGPGEFVTAVAGFIREGLSAGERAWVIAAPPMLEALQADLGQDAGDVDFTDAGSAYRRQATAARVMIDYLSGHRGGRCRVVAEQDLSRRGRAEIDDYLRMEAAANSVFGRYPVSILCPYDAGALPEDVLTGCLQTHPQLLTDHGLEPNAEFIDSGAYITTRLAVTEPPLDADSFACLREVDLAAARPFVRARAAQRGLAGDACDRLVQAVTEVLTNALKHGKPPRRMYVYTEGGVLVCHVHDSGAGLRNHLATYLPPGPGTGPGRGLWVARQLCDSVEIATDATGTHVRLLTALPDGTTGA